VEGPVKTEFRPVTFDDLELLLAWRAHPEVYEALYEQRGPYEWDRFAQWWESLEHVREWIIMVSESGHWRDVGVIRLLNLETPLPEIGVYVGELPLRRQGVGTSAVKFALNWLREEGYTGARAQIPVDNEASRNLFERIGFRHVGRARENERVYRIDFD
jgi:RimJ/RimL family protein N-acetyltransferase